MPNDDKILKMLKSKNPDKQTTALFVLMHEGKKTDYLDELLMCANNSDANVRLPAYMVLGKINRKKIIPYLEKGLKDGFLKIRMIAALSLAKYKNRKAIPVLTDMIRKDIQDHSLHKRAIEALGKYKEENIIGIFEQMLQHRRVVSRIKAAEALGKIESDKAYQMLVDAQLKETNPVVMSRIQNVIESFKHSQA